MKSIFFLVSSKHELFEFSKICEKINFNKNHVFLLIEKNYRNQNIDIVINDNVKFHYLPAISPSKLIFNNIHKKNQIIRIIEKLGACKSDFFFFFHNSSLLYFILSDFFSKKGLKKLMFVTSNFIIPKSNFQIKYIELLYLNLLCYPILLKKVHKKYFKGTEFSNTYIKEKINYIISLKNSTHLSAAQKFNIESFFDKKAINNVSSQKYLILVVSHWIEKFPNYINIINLLITKHGKENILIKDHPLSVLKKNELLKIFNISSENIIPKSISFENYIELNFSKFKTIYGPTSAALKYASFMGFDVICYQNLFSIHSDYKNHTLEYFKYHDNIKIISNCELSSFVYVEREKTNLVEHKLDYVFQNIL